MKKSIKVMIVDDSKTMREFIRNLLLSKSNDTQFEVVGELGNGLLAVQTVEQLNPDLVTIDLTMPEMDGFTAIKKMLEKKPELKILVVSSLNDIATALNAIENGASGFIQKPFSREELEEKITDVLTEDE